MELALLASQRSQKHLNNMVSNYFFRFKKYSPNKKLGYTENKIHINSYSNKMFSEFYHNARNSEKTANAVQGYQLLGLVDRLMG